jgi:hypothetical protein
METQTRESSEHSRVIPLHSGDRMDREEFHRVYGAMPDGFKAELIGGTVFVASPLKRKHATGHLPLGTAFFFYASRTPGLEAGDNATILLGEDSEPQPDLYLRILPEFGGRSRTTGDDYVSGPPELVGEIAHSSRSIDLHAKKDDYSTHGVLEYLVVCVHEEDVRWFDMKANRLYVPDAAGILRSTLFPGLWIDTSALFAGDAARLLATLEKGLASPEHAAFARKLAAAGPR